MQIIFVPQVDLTFGEHDSRHDDLVGHEALAYRRRHIRAMANMPQRSIFYATAASFMAVRHC